MQNAMCIGGDLDGTVMLVDHDRDWFRIQRRAPMPLFPSNDPVKAVEIQLVTYTKRRIAGLYVWAPDVMREQQIVQLLITRYFQNE